MRGHIYVKSPLDIACWDIMGQATGLPLCTLLGGRYVESYPVYRSISRQSPEKMVKDVDHFRSRDISVSSSSSVVTQTRTSVASRLFLGSSARKCFSRRWHTGWSTHQAIRIVNALAGEDLYIEQPCRSLEECLVVSGAYSVANGNV